MKQTVAILGASSNPERYAYKAFQSLVNHGHLPLLVNPKLMELEGARIYSSLKDIDIHVHTVTVYVSANISNEIKNELIQMRPDRVIFNPGSENPSLQAELAKACIPVMEACTLVLLSTEQF